MPPKSPTRAHGARSYGRTSKQALFLGSCRPAILRTPTQARPPRITSESMDLFSFFFPRRSCTPVEASSSPSPSSRQQPKSKIANKRPRRTVPGRTPRPADPYLILKPPSHSQFHQPKKCKNFSNPEKPRAVQTGSQGGWSAIAKLEIHRS